VREYRDCCNLDLACRIRRPGGPLRRLNIALNINIAHTVPMASNLRAGLSHSMQQPRGPLPTDSMTQLLLGPLNHLNSVAQQLFQSLSPPHTKPPPPPAIAALANADAALAEAIQSAHIHQKKQQRIEALKSEVLSLEASWRTVIMQLEEGRRDLEAIILEGDVHLDAIEQAKAGTAVHGFVRSMFAVIDGSLVRRHTVPRAPCICAESKRIYICTA
jgi:Vitamin-D-receptor interacting Mediator subunit 4